MKLNKKVATVTGSVRGLGWQIVQAYAQEGAAVVIVDLELSEVEEAVTRLGLPSERALGVKADISVEKNVLDLFQRIREKFNRLDVLVNNAGIAWPSDRPDYLTTVDTPFQDWTKVLGTNLNGTFLCGREALKMMRTQGNGSIINISSNHGKHGRPHMGAYCASKFGIEGLTQVMALENSSYNIRVNGLAPGGIVATERHLESTRYNRMQMLKSEVIRDCAVYLASDESTAITGQSLNACEWNKQLGIDVQYWMPA